MTRGYCGQCGGPYSDEVPCECQRRAGMSETKQPRSVEEALDQADLMDLDDVLIIGTRSDGNFFMRAYGLNRADVHYQMDLAKMFQLGLIVNGEDGEEGEQE